MTLQKGGKQYPWHVYELGKWSRQERIHTNEYTEMMGRAREKATHRMLSQAAGMGADAIINTRYTTTSVVGSAAELLVYGTAVKLSD